MWRSIQAGQHLDRHIVADGSIEPLLPSRLSLERESERVCPGGRDLGPARRRLGNGDSGRELSASWPDVIWDDFHKMNERLEIIIEGYV